MTEDATSSPGPSPRSKWRIGETPGQGCQNGSKHSWGFCHVNTMKCLRFVWTTVLDYNKTNRAARRWKQSPKKPFHHVSRDKILHDSWSISAALARVSPPFWMKRRPWGRGCRGRGCKEFTHPTFAPSPPHSGWTLIRVAILNPVKSPVYLLHEVEWVHLHYTVHGRCYHQRWIFRMQHDLCYGLITETNDRFKQTTLSKKKKKKKTWPKAMIRLPGLTHSDKVTTKICERNECCEEIIFTFWDTKSQKKGPLRQNPKCLTIKGLSITSLVMILHLNSSLTMAFAKNISWC